MPRTYKRKLGARSYKNYSDENVERALEKIVDHGWGIRKASKIYKIPYGTLHNHYHGSWQKWWSFHFFNKGRKFYYLFGFVS